jgi:N-acetylgalactosamine-6-sulfatase
MTGLSLAAMALASCQESIAKLSSPKKPNIIFIFSDDWGFGDLGVHGSTFCKTPNLDRIAKEGIDFTNFTVNSPVCSPSRTAVMTGHFPGRYCITQHFGSVNSNKKRGMPDWLDPAAVQLPKVLKDAGYATAHFGKWHLGSADDAPAPAAYGYDEYRIFNAAVDQAHEIEKSATSSCAATADFITRHKHKPFFINLWLHETHLPHLLKDKYLKRFKDLDERKKVYAAVVAEADAGVGLVMGTIKKAGIDDNTLVVFSSDNGPEWPGNDKTKKHHDGFGKYYSVGETAGLKGQKRSLYAGGVRVPFLVCWPGVAPAGVENRRSVITAVDLLPTFAELAGAKLPNYYKPDGESIVTAIKGGKFQRVKPIYWLWPGRNEPEELWPHLGIRHGKWKLLVNEEMQRVELYDIEADWAEKKNLAKAHSDC